MGWVLRLVETGVDGSGRSVDVMAIDCPGDLGDIAALGLTLAQESNRNRGAVQAAAASMVGWISLAGMAGYQAVNRSRSVPLRVRVRVCRSR